MRTINLMKYLDKNYPDMESQRKALADKVFKQCLEHKDEIIDEMDRLFFEIDKELPIFVAKRFQKLLYKNYEERKSYNLVGTIDSNGRVKELNNDYFPFIFDKDLIDAKLVETGILFNSTPLLDVLVLPTGKVLDSGDFIIYESYAYVLLTILEKKAEKILDSAIGKYTDGILKYPYDQYEDIKEIMNDVIYDTFGYISAVHFLKDVDAFVTMVGWRDKTINDILELSKTNAL